jgi:cytoskeletal protein CcmA (bactofilin family)
MFGKKKEKNLEPSFQRNTEYSVLSEGSKRKIEKDNIPKMKTLSARLSSDVQIEGTIKFDGIMMIDGSVNGKISTDNGKLVVSESGIIKATITTKNAVIDGRVDGNIVASDKVVLKKKAHLIGDLQAKTLVIEDGVVFIGLCNVNPEGVKADNIVKKDQPKTHHTQQGSLNINNVNTVKSAR